MRPEPKFLQYYVREKFASISLQIFKGFDIKDHGNWVPASRGQVYFDQGYTHIVTGLQYGSLKIFQQIYNVSFTKGREPYLFIDAGYLLAKPHLTNIDTWQLRIVPNAYQMNWISKNQDDSKLIALCVKGLQVYDGWRKTNPGKYILVIPPSSDAVTQIFGLQNWINEVLAKLVIYTKREIIIRRKGNEVSLMDHLLGAHAVIAYTSNVATDGAVIGIPTFCAKEAAASPISLRLENLDMIENPWYPSNELRESWLLSLANNQFSLKEIVSGDAKKKVIEEMQSYVST